MSDAWDSISSSRPSVRYARVLLSCLGSFIASHLYALLCNRYQFFNSAPWIFLLFYWSLSPVFIDFFFFPVGSGLPVLTLANLASLLLCASLLRNFPGLLLCSGRYIFLSLWCLLLATDLLYASEFYNFPWAVDVLRSYISLSYNFFARPSTDVFFFFRLVYIMSRCKKCIEKKFTFLKSSSLPSWCRLRCQRCRNFTQASQCLLGAWQMRYLFFLAGSPPSFLPQCRRQV